MTTMELGTVDTPAAPRLGTRLSAFRLAVGVCVMLVAGLIVYPLIRMAIRVFYPDGNVSIAAFRDAFELPGIVQTIVNTIFVVACGSVLATATALIVAWLNERTDARMGWISDVVPLLPLVIPAIATNIGFVILFSPRTGFGNVWIRAALDRIGVHVEEGPVDIYSMPVLIIAYSIFLMPLAYLPIAAGLRNLDPAYEEASRIAGSGMLRTLRRVTLPAVLPAVISGFLVASVIGLALFTAPIIIGTPAGIDVVSVRVFRLLTGEFPPRTGEAIALSTLLLVLIAAIWLVQRRVNRLGHFATISGRARQDGRLELGRWKWLARGSLLTYVGVTSILPLVALITLSFQGFWGQKIGLDHLSLDNYRTVLFDNDTTRLALTNSVALGVGGATAAVLVTTVVVRFTYRSRSLAGKLLDGLSKVPATVSPLIIGVSFVVAFAGDPFRLHGTRAILLICYFVLFLPYGSTIISGSYAQVGSDLLESSAVCGASQARTFRKVELPVLTPGLVAAWTLLFVLMASELTASALLTSTRSPVMGSVILDLYVGGSWTQIAALSSIMTALVGAVVLIAQLVGRVATRHR